MPSNVTAKIESALKRREAVTLLVAVVVFAIAILSYRHMTQTGKTLTFGGHTYTLELATTTKQQEHGLSDRRSMPRDHGMLFVYQQEKKECFWMKDMHFPLDMIWLDADHKVIYIANNVSPDTYPDTICPGDPAEFVIELNAGQAAEAGILQDSVLQF